ncbi:hypothetical protein PUN28_000215 [Cardiocondyla obscurior]|uniref:Uncharacterized protein n=3 Tax=Cardiocondyla obscurior TaxID=286306 RepID=A0AAW2GY82_9HYME
MSCTHCRIMDLHQDEVSSNFKYPHSCCTTTHYTSTVKNVCTKVCTNKNYSNWRSSNLSRNNNDTFKKGTGDPLLPDSSVQMGRIRNAHTYELMMHRESAPVVLIERMQVRLKLLEDSNATLHLRNRDLITKNKSLTKRQEENVIKIEKLENNVSLLQNKLDKEKANLVNILTKQPKYDKKCLENKCTSSTNIISKTDRGLQIWEACKDCQGKLEGCQKDSFTRITITKSEYELLERDMRTLRDAVIAREEAWNKAMERERNCQQQLARLTAEAIVSRHLCETCQNELRAVTDTLTKKESELKMIRKEVQYLNKLIVKLLRRQRELEKYSNDSKRFYISKKDQRYIEEIARRVQNSKSKSKRKVRCNSDKYSRLISFCEIKRNQADSSEDRRKLNFQSTS